MAPRTADRLFIWAMMQSTICSALAGSNVRCRPFVDTMNTPASVTIAQEAATQHVCAVGLLKLLWLCMQASSYLADCR